MFLKLCLKIFVSDKIVKDLNYVDKIKRSYIKSLS